MSKKQSVLNNPAAADIFNIADGMLMMANINEVEWYGAGFIYEIALLPTEEAVRVTEIYTAKLAERVEHARQIIAASKAERVRGSTH